MTEEEKDKLRQAKADVTDLLANIDIDRYRLTEIDSRLDSYVRMVAGNPDAPRLYFLSFPYQLFIIENAARKFCQYLFS